MANSNIDSQIVSGTPRVESSKRDAAVGDAGANMSKANIALLKTLALRPSAHVAANVQHLVDVMAEAGCIYFGPTGWMATEHGCAVLEHERAKARPRNAGYDTQTRR